MHLIRIRRERNREHAKNTRLRKKAYVESLKQTVDELCRERDTLVTERANAANLMIETHSKRVDVMRSFFALRAGYSLNQKRELWSSILDESGFNCRLPVTPYQSFPSSEVQLANCQRTISGIDAMIADAASNSVSTFFVNCHVAVHAAFSQSVVLIDASTPVLFLCPRYFLNLSWIVIAIQRVKSSISIQC